MNSYVFTIFFLMIMSLLTSSEAIRFSQNSLEKNCYRNSWICLAAAEEARELSHIETLRKECTTHENPSEETEERVDKPLRKTRAYIKHARALGINAARPPDNSRLNFYTLLHREPPKDSPKDFSLYDTCARLMRMLYKDESFFHEIDHAETRILDRFIEKKEACLHFSSPDQLSTIDLENDTLQKIFFKMLQGTKHAPSLLNYITFDKIDEGEKKQIRKINLLFTDPLIIQAIFPDGDTAKKIIAQRDHIWEKIENQEENRLKMKPEECRGRAEFANELKIVLEHILIDDGFNAKKYKSHVFDCTLGSPGSIIFLEDPLSAAIIREYYNPPTREKKRGL